MNARTLSLLSLLAVLALLPTSAGAQDADPRLEQYRQVATGGQEAFNRGDYAGARRLWEHARSILPNPRIYALLGRVAYAMSEHVVAVRMYRLALSVPENGNPLNEARRQEVERVLLSQALEHVGELLLEIEPADAAVTVDGRPAIVEDGSLLLPVGSYALRVRRPGYRDHERALRVLSRAREPLHIVLEREGAAASSGAGSGEIAPAAASSTGPDVVGPLVLFGVAAGGAVVYAIGGGLAIGENDRLARDCGASGTCTDAQLSDLHSLTLVADLGWVAAAIAAAAGVAWLIVALGENTERSSAVRITPWGTADAGGVLFSGEIGGF